MLKVIYIVNWIVIGLLALLVAAETISPAKGGDAAGRGLGQAIYYLAIISCIVLLILNLLPFNWSKYLAFALILSPLVLIKLDSGLTSLRAWMSRKPEGYNQDGTPWFKDKLKQQMALAINDGDVQKFKKLLQEPGIALNDSTDGGLLIEFAVGTASGATYRPEEKIECVRLLFDAGAALPKSGESENDPIHQSVAATGNARLLKLLLEHGADPNAHGFYIKRPVLFEAISSYQDPLGSVRLLLDAGADPNTTYTEDETNTLSALLFAGRYGRWNICSLLIERGADIRYVAPDGQSMKTVVDAVEDSYTGDGYSNRADYEQVKKLVQAAF